MLRLQMYVHLTQYNPWQKEWNQHSWKIFIQLFNFVEKKLITDMAQN